LINGLSPLDRNKTYANLTCVEMTRPPGGRDC